MEPPMLHGLSQSHPIIQFPRWAAGQRYGWSGGWRLMKLPAQIGVVIARALASLSTLARAPVWLYCTCLWNHCGDVYAFTGCYVTEVLNLGIW